MAGTPYYSINEFPGNGVQTNFDISFAGGYLSRSHVKAYVANSDKSTQVVTFEWIADFQVRMYPPIPTGQTLVVYRQTPIDTPLADFNDGAILTEDNLDLNARQAVFAIAEATDLATRALTSATGAKGETGPQGPIGAQGPSGRDTVAQAAAVDASWASLGNLRRTLKAAAFNPGTVIKIAGIGSSNMANDNGGLAGVGNSPVEILLRSLKAELDPLGFCTWDFRNFGVNGSAIGGWGQRLNGNPLSPKELVEAYKPTVVFMCYQTNDASPESFNSGQTRNAVQGSRYDIFAWGAQNDWDIVDMTAPHPNSAANKQNLYDDNGVLHIGGRAMNGGIGSLYPVSSFAAGQTPFTRNFTVGTNNTITAQDVGLFKTSGFGIVAGGIIDVRDKNLGDTVPNTGIWRIKTVDATGTIITVDNAVSYPDGYTKTIGAPAAFTAFSGNLAIRRVGINPFTELFPKFDDAYATIALDKEGHSVIVSTRMLLINADARAAVAASEYPASLIDVEPYYLNALVQKPELYYYTRGGGVDTVHWNSFGVTDWLEPAIRDWARALGRVQRGVSGGERQYQRKLTVRPYAGDDQPVSQLNATRTVDMQLSAGSGAVIRDSAGKIAYEWTDSGKTIQRKMNNLYLNKEQLADAKSNIGTDNPVVITFAREGGFYGYVYSFHPGISRSLYRVEGVFDGGSTITFACTRVASGAPFPNADPFDVAAVGNQLKFTPKTTTTTIWAELFFIDANYNTGIS